MAIFSLLSFSLSLPSFFGCCSCRFRLRSRVDPEKDDCNGDTELLGGMEESFDLKKFGEHLSCRRSAAVVVSIVLSSIFVMVATTAIFWISLSAMILLFFPKLVWLSPRKIFFSLKLLVLLELSGDSGASQSVTSLSPELFKDLGEESCDVMFDKLVRNEVSSSIRPSTLKNVESWKDAGSFESVEWTIASEEDFAEGRKRLVIFDSLSAVVKKKIDRFFFLFSSEIFDLLDLH